jgi:hypothetical protein
LLQRGGLHKIKITISTIHNVAVPNSPQNFQKGSGRRGRQTSQRNGPLSV